MNREELVRKAQHIVAGRRQKALTQAQMRQNEIYARVPALSEWQSEKAAAGIEAARLAAAGAGQEAVAAAMEKLRALDEKRAAILTQAGLCERDLAPRFSCALCEDTGRSSGTLCQCVEDLVRAMRRESVNENSPLALCSFDGFDLNKYPQTLVPELGITVRAHMATIFNYCKSYAEAFGPHADSLYLCGYAGLGKTHLALSIARCVLDKGYDVVYVSAQEAMDRVEKERFGASAGDTMAALLHAELLILDDLGTEYISPYISACLYDVINTRCNKRLPTIYTSNILNDADLRRRYTEKIVSRLLGSCEVLQFCGDDIRLLEK